MKDFFGQTFIYKIYLSSKSIRIFTTRKKIEISFKNNRILRSTEKEREITSKDQNFEIFITIQILKTLKCLVILLFDGITFIFRMITLIRFLFLSFINTFGKNNKFRIVERIESYLKGILVKYVSEYNKLFSFLT